MYDYNKVINGVAKYIDDEIVNKITGWQRWVVGSGVGIALSNATNVFNQLKNNEFVKMLGVIDEKDRIDVDKIYKELKKQAQKGAITFNAPMIGAITLNEQDVEKVYGFIKSE
jgi:DNA-binding transcriptional regulator LsrR (DeoR family)